jgi:hypothetical protein
LYWNEVEGEFSTGNYYSAFYSIFHPSFFSFYPVSRDGCVELITTSIASEEYNCEYAVNGGFFTWDITVTGSLCKGNLVSDGFVWQLPTDGSGTGRANFGITSDDRIITGAPVSIPSGRITFSFHFYSIPESQALLTRQSSPRPGFLSF